MGIKNLIKIIKIYSPGAIKYKTINDYTNYKLGIDTNLMIYKIIYAVRRNGYDLKNDGLIITHIHGILQKLVAFRKYKITPIFVFDNIPHEMKHDTMVARDKFRTHLQDKYDKAITQDEKKKYYYARSDVTGKEIDDVINIIKIFGYEIIIAKEEADAELAYLSKKKIIDGIITDDMDILVFGGKLILKNFTIAHNKKIQEINLKKFLKDARLTQRHLIDIAILIGCDYCKSASGIGPIKAYNIIKKYGSIDNTDISINNLNKVRKYFMEPPVIKYKDSQDNIKNIDKHKLIDFLKDMKFKQKYIDGVMKKLK